MRSPPAPFAPIGELLIARGVKFVLIGGHAVAAHGKPRLTEDLRQALLANKRASGRDKDLLDGHSRRGRAHSLSISIDARDLALLKRRAKQGSGGNISAATTEMIRIAREWEAREALAAWLGEGRAEPTTEVVESIRAEWRGARRANRRTKAA